MTSPFLRNRTSVLARQAGQAASASEPKAIDEATQAGQEYAQLKVRLDDQLRQLQDTESVAARVPMKVEFIKGYADWVDGVVEADAPVQDEILLTCLIWSIDIGEFQEAVRLGAFALKHGLQMPERYKRGVACFLREDIADEELKAPGTVDLPLMTRIDELTQGADMHDVAKAKLHKAMGRAWVAKADGFKPDDDNAPAGGEAAFLTEALTEYERALKLNAKVGVKKDIEKLKRRLAKLAPSEGPGATQE